MQPSEAIIHKILLDTKGNAPFPTIADRPPWDARKEHPTAVLARQEAEAALGQPVPALPATLYLDTQRTGRRGPFQKLYFGRRATLTYLTLTECLENQGRFLDAIVDYIWAICEESTWVVPAHANGLPDTEFGWVDLFAAGTAEWLSEVDYLLGDKLPAVVRKRIRHEVQRRVVEPYLTHTEWGWLGGTGHANNWNAVCNLGVVSAALLLETDLMLQARVMAKALASLPAYLASFDADGCTSEGPGYWSYGFGCYAMLAHFVESRTEGKLRLLDGERFQKICRFPVQLELSPGKFAAFSDALEKTIVPAGICCWLAERCGVPELGALGRRHLRLPEHNLHHLSQYTLRNLLWGDPAPATQEGLQATTWYGGFQWLISRVDPCDAAGLVLAAKAGHNDEDHNQNDLGQFIVHSGCESLILDLGRPDYTRQFFGPDRYTFLEARSGGHCVPLVNGFEQLPGREYAARLVRTEFSAYGDTMELELAGAYPAEAGIASIFRKVALVRTTPSGEVLVRDHFRFAGGKGLYESRLHTFGEIDLIRPGYVRITGRQATAGLYYDPGSVQFEAETVKPEANSLWGPLMYRLRFLVKAREGTVALRIQPE